jgi:hypothetical protein
VENTGKEKPQASHHRKNLKIRKTKKKTLVANLIFSIKSQVVLSLLQIEYILREFYEPF